MRMGDAVSNNNFVLRYTILKVVYNSHPLDVGKDHQRNVRDTGNNKELLCCSTLDGMFHHFGISRLSRVSMKIKTDILEFFILRDGVALGNTYFWLW